MSAAELLVSARRSLTGALLLPHDDGFDAARLPWNLAVAQHPAAVAIPAGVDDLRVLLQAARDSGLRIAVQPSGHGASGDLAETILVRMSRFDDLRVDTQEGVVTAGAGVSWGAVVSALEGSGWAAPAGTSPVVSVAGYTLNGGHSWFSRTAGLGSDNLRAVWLLRPDGSHDRIDDDTDPELMWSLRGAAGVVGIVTALEIDLVPTPHPWGASLMFDAADSAAVLRAVRDLAPEAPASLNVFVNSMRMPDVPLLPDEVRGRSFVAVQLLSADGAAASALDALCAAAAPLRQAEGPTSPAALIAQSNEPTEPMAGRGVSAALTGMDDRLIDALIDFRERPEQWPLMGVELRMLGGALRTPRRPGFAGVGSSEWLVHGLAPLFPDAPALAGEASLAGLADVLAPAASDRLVPTFLSAGETLERSAPTADLERLRAVRERLDPEALLHEGRLPR
ncbi:FAD-binding oxidoreductase [Microbacterium sp. 179-I 3D4 NHS]|uniref:FAD-binding oxidoreductase n=1 Tax=Microbacterium sp. 179-I 3D4 NHS TaxID=3142381 RepID=UPI0039A3F816